ncbi:hypothetical protein F66182_17080 [Fusarium sp. NRRL 66182]|nr:hypothetical protein F66182_17080 [Fusarium sp. NRRL 66182]
MTKFTIDITSDTVCPWCYVGVSRLDRAIKEHTKLHPGDTFDLKWHTFYLNPDAAPYPGVNKLQLYETRFGGPGRVQGLVARLRAVGEPEGINFSFGGNTGSTKDSHRLLYQVGQQYGGEKQTLVAKALFKSYFEKEENVTDKKVLLRAALDSGAGLSEKEVKGWLDSDVGRAEVDKEADEARANWIQGVPHFLIQGQYAVEGAEDPAQFLKVFSTIKNAQ